MTEPLTVTVALYQLDHLSARFRHELPDVVYTPPGVELIAAHARVGIDLPLREWAALGRPGTVTLTIQPGTVPPESAERSYKAGDPDPTPDLPSGTQCFTRAPGGGNHLCTWERGHDGPHVAGDGEIIVATWNS